MRPNRVDYGAKCYLQWNSICNGRTAFCALMLGISSPLVELKVPIHAHREILSPCKYLLSRSKLIKYPLCKREILIVLHVRAQKGTSSSLYTFILSLPSL